MMAAPILQIRTYLRELLSGLQLLSSGCDRPLVNMTLDSRQVAPGDLFVARRGLRSHGLDHVAEALERGAAAVLAEREQGPVEFLGTVPVVSLPKLGESLGRLADRFYGSPSRELWLAAVTGTNGKTSVSHFVAQAIQTLAERGDGSIGPCGLIGTLGYGVYGDLQPAGNTTPDVISVHRGLSEMLAAGIRHVMMEVSSHALDQGRIDGVRLDVGAFTNLSRDHLDYHGDMQAYGRAKGLLFRTPGLQYAVVNLDDEYGVEIADGLGHEVRLNGYSLAPDRHDAVFRARSLETRAEGLSLEVVANGSEGRLDVPLIGRFNAANLLAALAVLMTLRLPLPVALASLSAVQSIPGRLERFPGGRHAPTLIVDYAHTPDALAQAILAVREHCSGRLGCVFGCGGERDRGKRREMGAVAARLADRVVLTDDNPRGEDGDGIIEDIILGMGEAAPAVERDRRKAIGLAFAELGADDVLLVAGKGHEDYQEVNGIRYPYSDRETVQRIAAGHSA